MIEQTLDQLGREAKSRMDLLDKYKDKAEQMAVSAGMIICEAHTKISLEGGTTFALWCDDYKISYSRAYEVMAITRGDKTVEQVNSRGGVPLAERSKAYRARQKEASPVRTGRTPETNIPPEPEIKMPWEEESLDRSAERRVRALLDGGKFKDWIRLEIMINATFKVN
jgi:hypothetical protein